MAIRYSLIKSSFIVLLLFFVCGPVLAQSGGAVNEHLGWMPAGSYIGFMHYDSNSVPGEIVSVIEAVVGDLEVLNIRGANKEQNVFTVGMVQGLDRQRQRKLEKGTTNRKKGGMWFFYDELVVVDVPDLANIIRKGMDAGYLTLEKSIYKVPVYKQTNEESEKPVWIGKISDTTLVLSNERNQLVAALKAGTGRAESVMDDPALSEMPSLIPDSFLWFIGPERISLQKDYQYAMDKGEAGKKLAAMSENLAERPEYLIITFSQADGLTAVAEAIFDDAEIAEKNRIKDPDWATDFLPFDRELILEINDGSSGRFLKSTIVFDIEKIIARHKQNPDSD